MPALLAHMNLVKDLVKENPKIFSSADLKYLVQGATFPDIYYITELKSIVKKPNLSKFIHENDIDYSFAKTLLKKSKNKPERLFAIGLLSHLILDKRVHDYLKEKGIYTDIKHMVSEYYLETKFQNSKIPTPRLPLKLIKEGLKEQYPKDYNIYKTRIKLSIKSVLFYEFANTFIIKKIINGRYRTENNKTRWSLLNLPFKLARMSKYKKMGYDYTALLNPDISVKTLYLEDLYKKYIQSKKELINMIVEQELHVIDYMTHQTEIRDFI